MSRAPSRRAILAMAGGVAAAAVPVVTVSAKPAPAVPDPVVALWRELQRAMRRHEQLGVEKHALYARRDEMTDNLRPDQDATQCQWRAYHQAFEKAGEECGYHEAWKIWCAAGDVVRAGVKRLIATPPTTVRGVMAKVSAAKRLIRSDEEHEAVKMLASLQHIDPRTLAMS